MYTRPCRWCLVLSLLGLAACNISLPEESLIVDPRILGIRAVGAEPDLDDPLAAGFASGSAVRLEVLVVDPSGPLDASATRARWFACPLAPGQAAFSCLDAATPLDPATLTACPGTGAAPLAPLTGPCVLGDGLTPSLTLPPPAPEPRGATVGVIVALVADDDQELADCVAPLLAGDYDTPDACRYAASTIGRAEGPGGVNNHPRAPTVELSVREGDVVVEQMTLTSDASLTISGSQTITLAPSLASDDPQTYLVPQNGGQMLVSVTEEITATWFRTDGAFAAAQGLPLLPGSLEQTWRPDGSPGATIYLVLRDGRGGSSWWSLDVSVAAD